MEIITATIFTGWLDDTNQEIIEHINEPFKQVVDSYKGKKRVLLSLERYEEIENGRKFIASIILGRPDEITEEDYKEAYNKIFIDENLETYHTQLLEILKKHKNV